MRLILITIIIIFLISCKNDSGQKESSPAASLPEGFLSFYESFHRDSVYQMEHIVFPLAGRPSHQDSLTSDDNFYWKKNEWKLHKPFDPSNETFEQSFELIGENMVVDFINTPNGSMYMERRFANMADGWHLIYFADLRYAGYE